MAKGQADLDAFLLRPPVYISEDEAKKLICSALLKENLILETENCPSIKVNQLAYHSENMKDDTNSFVEIPMDAYNKEYNLAIQYFSAEDIHKYGFGYSHCGTSSHISTLSAAEYFHKECEKQSKFHTVVFYDPLTGIPHDNTHSDITKEEKMKKYKEISRKKILAQVEDFIVWLKKEEILEK